MEINLLAKIANSYYLTTTVRVLAEICRHRIVQGQFGNWTPIGAEQTEADIALS